MHRAQAKTQLVPRATEVAIEVILNGCILVVADCEQRSSVNQSAKSYFILKPWDSRYAVSRNWGLGHCGLNCLATSEGQIVFESPRNEASFKITSLTSDLEGSDMN